MHIITTTAELQETCARLATFDFVTVDTEFHRETTFWPELCLIQMAGPDLAVIVDPLAKALDLKPFFKLMADPGVTKVFHAARQDIEIVFHLGGLIPMPVFDTQIAAMVCGFGDSVSYNQLVQKITGVQLDKSSRFTDWRQRPLSDRQLTYALADVTYLRDIHAVLSDRIKAENRSGWLSEEIAVLESPETYDLHPDDAWKRLRARLKKPRELAVLRAVAAWREREARNRNVPRGRILKDDSLFEVAQQQPVDPVALGKLRSIPKGWENAAAARGLLEAVGEAMAIAKEDLPKVPRQQSLPEGTSAAVEFLKVLLKLTSEKNGVAAKLIANTSDLEKIAVKGAEADVACLTGWRRSLFGEAALKLISGDVALRFMSGRIETVDIPPAASSPMEAGGQTTG